MWLSCAAVAGAVLVILLVHLRILYACLPVALVLPVFWVCVEVKHRHYAGLVLGLLSLVSLLFIFALANRHQDSLYRGVLQVVARRSAELVDGGHAEEISASLRRFSLRLEGNEMSLWRALTSLQHDLRGDGRESATRAPCHQPDPSGSHPSF